MVEVREMFCKECNDFMDYKLHNENDNAEVWECCSCEDTQIIPK
jgi:RNase P subunit RPR2